MGIRYNFLALLSQIEAHLYRAKSQIEDGGYQSAAESLNQASEACQLLNMADGKPVQDIIDLLLPELGTGLEDQTPAQIQLDGALAHVKGLRDSLETG